MGRPLFGDPQNVLHDEGESKKFQHIRAQRWKSPLTSCCNEKGKIRGLINLRAFWLQRRVFYRQTIVKALFAVHLA